MVSHVSVPQCGQRMLASVTGFAMRGTYSRAGGDNSCGVESLDQLR